MLGIGCLIIVQGSSWSSQFSLCRCLLCSMVWISCRYHKCSAFGWYDFLFSIRVCTRILCLSNDLGGCCRRSIQDASSRSIFDSYGISGIVCCLLVVDKRLSYFYRTIYCSFATNFSGISCPLLLHVSGVADFLVLE